MPDTFTPEQIAQILEAFFAAVGTRQYIGARYVPIFGRKDETSIIWDNSEPYEPLTIVLYQGNSFTSRQYVPAGVEIDNQEFWANTGNYNAQVEQYRQEVAAFDSRITANATAISAEETARQNADTTLTNRIAAEETARQSADTALTERIATEETTRQNADTALDERLDDLEEKPVILCFGDSYGATYDADGRGLWSKQLNDLLSDRYTIKNFCIGNSTFSRNNGDGTPIIYNEVTTAIQDTSYNHEKVEIVVVCGGRNDVRSSVTNAVNGVRDTLEYISQNFPHARIAVGIGNWWAHECTEEAKFRRMQFEAQRMPNCVCTEGLWNALLPFDDYTPESTNTHPIPSGMRLITNRLLGAMFGGCVQPVYTQEYTGEAAAPFNNFYAEIHGSQIHCKFTLSNVTAETITLSDALKRFFVPIQNYFMGVSATTGDSVAARINNDMTMQFYQAGANVIFDYWSIR